MHCHGGARFLARRPSRRTFRRQHGFTFQNWPFPDRRSGKPYYKGAAYTIKSAKTEFGPKIYIYYGTRLPKIEKLFPWGRQRTILHSEPPGLAFWRGDRAAELFVANTGSLFKTGHSRIGARGSPTTKVQAGFATKKHVFW